MKYKANKKHIIAAVAVAYIVLTALLSRGNSYYVESDEPLEDIVMECRWSSAAFPGLHGGGHHVSRRKGVVLKSGEVVSCGMNWFAGLTLAFRSYGGLSHPTHQFEHVGERDDGVSVVRAKSKLELLDELKEKFEAGYWDNHRSPGAEYARNLVNCSFGYRFFDYYSEAKKVNKEHFKRLYHESMLECFKRKFSIKKKYDPKIGKQLPTADEWMRRTWTSDKWSQY